jgi:hypothetical protein
VSSFAASLSAIIAAKHTRLAIGLAPVVEKLPLALARYDDPFLPFGKALIAATGAYACAYVFHLGAYLAYGAAGAVALERTLACVPAGCLRILHGAFGNADYARAASDHALNVQAVTLAKQLEQPEAYASYLPSAGQAVFFAGGVPNLPPTHASQVGFYQITAPMQAALHIAGEVLAWRWDEAIFSTRADDYAEQWRANAARLAGLG